MALPTGDSAADTALELRLSAAAYEFTRAFGQLAELDELLPTVIRKLNAVLRAESSAIILLDETTGELYFPYVAAPTTDLGQRLAAVRFPSDKGIAGWVLRHGQVQIVPDVAADERWYPEVDGRSGVITRSLLCAPLRSSHGPLGVIEVCNKIGGEFDGADAALIGLLADSIAVAIENARLYGDARQVAERLQDEVVALHREVLRHSRFDDIVGSSPDMRRVFELMESAIASPVTVLLRGETGTGKELIARAIHYNGARRERPFVAVNCGALQDTLLESELFGHRKGAFTGALMDRKGLFEVADGGTVFLDEVGDTSPAMQVKLLRVLQEGEITPIGETRPRKVDVRVISATHRDLEEAVAAGAFREDLYYRLSAFPIEVPPLRQRPEDIPLLAVKILERTSQKFGKPVRGLSRGVVDLLVRHTWPGNVRELQNEIERAVALVPPGEAVKPGHLSPRLHAALPVTEELLAQPTTLRTARERFEREFIAGVLRQNGGNASRTARVLGISRVMLQTKIKHYGLRGKPHGGKGSD
jgi:Nif-specific regulatory protein